MVLALLAIHLEGKIWFFHLSPKTGKTFRWIKMRVNSELFIWPLSFIGKEGDA
jgi:hypothetical protein